MATLGSLGNLVVSLEANMARFNQDMQAAVGVVERSTAKMSEAVSKLREGFETLAKAAGLAMTLDAVVGKVQDMISAGAGFADLSIRTGIAVETLSRFDKVAKLSGTSIEEVAETLKRLTVSATDAATGHEKLASLFESLGIRVKDANGQIIKADQLLINLASSVQGIEPEVVTRLMSELAGKSGDRVLPFLRELNERLSETNATITEQFAISAKAYDDNMKLLTSAANAFWRELTANLLPALVRITDEMLRAKQEGGLLASLWAGFKGLQVEIQADFTKPEAEIARFQDKLERARRMLEALSSNAVLRLINADDIALTKAQIGVYEQAIRQLEQVRERAQQSLNPPVDRAKTQRVVAALTANSPKSAAQTELEALGRDAAKLAFQVKHVEDFQDRITSAREAQIAFDLEQSRFGAITQAQREQLTAAAQAVDRYGLALKNAMTSLQFSNRTKELEQEAQWLGKSTTQRQLGLDLQALENAGIAQGTALFERLAQAREKALSARDAAQVSQQIELMRASREHDIELLGLQAQALSMNQRGFERLIESRRLAFSVQEATRTMSAPDAERYRREALALFELAERTKDLNDARSRTLTTGVQQSLRTWIDEVTNVAKATEALLTNAFRSIEDALVSMVRTGKLDFRSLADSIIADLIRIQIRQQMLPWLSNPATGSSLIGWLSGMFRAQGGPVSAARPYVVGEQGPELFIPNVSGMMLANAALQSDAAPNVSIYQNITVDARADRASVIAAMHQAKESAKLEILRSLQRGGGFHQALGR